jgi:hypothetical protein
MLAVAPTGHARGVTSGHAGRPDSERDPGTVA